MSSLPPPSRSPAEAPSRPPGRFHLGCAVWAFEGWFGTFYPPGTRPKDSLRLYGERLTAVEGNTTFYGIPSPEALARWRADTPAGFRFCPKLHRDLSHRPDLAASIDGAAAFRDRLALLDDRLGPTLVQLPGRTGPGAFDELARLLRAWPAAAFPAALEVRHPGWFEEPDRRRLLELLGELGLGTVVLDTRPVYESPDDPQVRSERRKPRLPVQPAATGPLAFVRYIGHPELERNAPYLDQWAGRVDTWLREGRDVTFFTHCPSEEYSPFLARTFQTMLEDRGAPVPALPWDRVGEAPRQLGLFG